METFSIVKKVCTVYTKPISQKVSMVLRFHISYDPNKIDTAILLIGMKNMENIIWPCLFCIRHKKSRKRRPTETFEKMCFV